MSQKQLDKARCLLLTHAPWYGHAATWLRWSANRNVDAMGVRIVNRGQAEVAYNPVYVQQHTPLELAAVIQHELEHVLRCHCLRAPGRDAHPWNIACDMCVNGSRTEPRIGLLDPGTGVRVIPEADVIVWIPSGWPLDATAEQYYQRLLDDSAARRNGSGVRLLDDHSVWQTSEASAADAMALAAAVMAASQNLAQGMPAHWRGAIRETAPPQIGWKTQLRRFVQRIAGDRTLSWSRRNRRCDVFGVPGHKRERRSVLTVIVDVSGSVSTEELGRFFGEIDAVCGEALVSVLLWDHALCGFHARYRPGDWRHLTAGGGGSDMAAPVEWLVAERKVGDGIILFTDGFCTWPVPHPFPLLTVVTGPAGQVAGPNWGKTIYLNAR